MQEGAPMKTQTARQRKLKLSPKFNFKFKIIDIDHSGGLEFSYDPEWLAILQNSAPFFPPTRQPLPPNTFWLRPLSHSWKIMLFVLTLQFFESRRNFFQ
jgi:hypothetical protein